MAVTRAAFFQLCGVLALPLCVLAGTLPATNADAEAIQTVQGGFAFGVGTISSFDRSLGTLDSVSVTMVGQINLEIGTVPMVTANGPLPYSYTASVGQEFQGAAFSSFAGTGSFSSIQGIADGLGDPQSQVIPFFFDFQFTALSDLIGFTNASSSDPGSTSFLMAGTRAGFAPAPFSVPLVEASSVSLFPTSSSGLVSLLLADVEGSMSVEYDYTPTNVPEPGSLLLLFSGLVGLAGSRWLPGVLRRRSAATIAQ